MSHLTTVKAQIKNLASLIESLKWMGLTPQQGDLTIDNAYWNSYNPKKYPLARQQVQVKIAKEQISSNCHTDIGWSWDAEAKLYQMRADESELRRWVQNPKCEGFTSFVQQMNEGYLRAELAKLGNYKVVDRVVLPDGSIQLVGEQLVEEALLGASAVLQQWG